jgi:hypothetical protein
VFLALVGETDETDETDTTVNTDDDRAADAVPTRKEGR